MRLKFSGLLTAIALGLAGCANSGQTAGVTATALPQKYEVAIDSYATSILPEGSKYFIVPHRDCDCAGDLLFQELAGYIGSVLNEHNFKPAGSIDNAAVIVALNYGVLQHPKYREGRGPAMRYFNVSGFSRGTSRLWGPVYGPGHGVGMKLWETHVASPGYDRELRRAIPVLAITAAPYLTRRSGERVYLTTDATVEMVEAFRTRNQVVALGTELAVTDAQPMVAVEAAE